MSDNRVIWHHEEKDKGRVKWVCFLIFPFFSFLISLFSLNTKSSYRIVFLFFLLYGMCFTVGTNREIWTGDSAGYREEFEDMGRTNFNAFAQSITDYFSFEVTQYKDIFNPMLMFVTSRVTNNYHFLFLVYAALFGFLTLKCLKYLTLDESYKNNSVCFLLFLIFTFNQLFNINGFRFYFAAWVGVYCIFKILIDNKNIYWILLLITPLIHISFLLFVAVFVLCFFLKSFINIWSILFFISIFFSSITQGLDFMKMDLPPLLTFMVDAYLSKDAIAEYESTLVSVAWYTRILQILCNFYPSLLMIVLIKNRRLFNGSKDNSIFLFCVAYITIANFIAPLSSMGRFLIICYPIVGYLWLRAFKGEKYNILINLMPLFLFLPFYKYLGDYLVYTPAELLYMNPFVLVFKYLL